MPKLINKINGVTSFSFFNEMTGVYVKKQIPSKNVITITAEEYVAAINDTNSELSKLIQQKVVDVGEIEGIETDSQNIGKVYAINSQTSTTYNLVLSDTGSLITLTNASPISVVIPTEALVAFKVGTHIDFIQGGVGKVTFSGVGITIKSKNDNKSIAAQNVAVSLIKVSTNTWYLIGDIVA